MLFLSRQPTNVGLMHIIEIRKLSWIYQIVKEVDFFQLKKPYNPFKGLMFVSFIFLVAVRKRLAGKLMVSFLIVSSRQALRQTGHLRKLLKCTQGTC